MYFVRDISSMRYVALRQREMEFLSYHFTIRQIYRIAEQYITKKQLPEKEFSDPLVRVVLSYSVTSRGICVPNLKATILIKPAHFASDFFIFPHLCGIQTGICRRFLQKRGKNPILPHILFALRFLIRAGVCATEALRRSCCADHFGMPPAAYRKRR